MLTRLRPNEVGVTEEDDGLRVAIRLDRTVRPNGTSGISAPPIVAPKSKSSVWT